MQAAGGYAVDHRIDATLHGLGLGNELFNVPVGSLSGGQKARLALAKLLLSEPDLLLLDEPTNHLDIAGRIWLEEFLGAYRGAVVIISHDRWLLNKVAGKIYELETGKLVEYPGNYEKFRELRALRRLTLQREYEKQQDKIKREQAFIDRYRAGQRARQAQGREKRLERFKANETMDRPMELDSMSLRFGAAQRTGDLIINADGLAKGYENKPLFDHVFLTLKRGDRIGIIGPNGAGKSTLVRCLLGDLEPDAGQVRVGNQVNVGHFKQTHEDLNLSLTVVEYLRHQLPPNASEQAARDLAGAFLFSGLEQEKPLSVMSGGEKARAVLAGLVAGNHNVLVLDEPSNHLDISSAERLEEALKQFTEPPAGFGQQTSGGGTLILISHDRWLLESLVDQMLVLDGEGRVTHFHGKYSEYAAAQKAASAPAKPESKPKPQPAPPPPPKAKAPADKGKPKKSRFSHLSQQALEQRIIEVERELAKIDQQLADPNVYRDGAKVRELQTQRDDMAGELKPLEEEWARRAEN
jgi:ATP-binding cassette subfamily F protein 3